MIHWTDIAGQLAQSGKFKVRVDKRVDTIKDFHIRIFGKENLEFWFSGGFRDTYKIQDCTPIARSVDDMTKGECDMCLALLGGNTLHNDAVLMSYFEGQLLDDFPTPLFLYLISIGVLPPNISTEGVEFITPNGE